MHISKRIIFWTCLMIVLIVMLNTLNTGRTATAQVMSTPPIDDTDCQPGSGWRWVPGDGQSGLAEQVQRELRTIRELAQLSKRKVMAKWIVAAPSWPEAWRFRLLYQKLGWTLILYHPS